MSPQQIAKDNLNECKIIAKSKKIQSKHLGKKYLVYSSGSSIPAGYFKSFKDAMEYIEECVSYDSWLYEKFEDECILTDYWITEISEKVVEYYLVNEKE